MRLYGTYRVAERSMIRHSSRVGRVLTLPILRGTTGVPSLSRVRHCDTSCEASSSRLYRRRRRRRPEVSPPFASKPSAVPPCVPARIVWTSQGGSELSGSGHDLRKDSAATRVRRPNGFGHLESRDSDESHSLCGSCCTREAGLALPSKCMRKRTRNSHASSAGSPSSSISVGGPSSSMNTGELGPIDLRHRSVRALHKSSIAREPGAEVGEHEDEEVQNAAARLIASSSSPTFNISSTVSSAIPCCCETEKDTIR
mmetsp:Transcript_58675/g.86018  ORF Transcript_58675/g.86018 Transcript_58675/m.86018 type:complete len:256 (+) Transcript_58675:496-1263(+)